MTAKPSKTVTTRVWYIFIDVVEFTGQGRSMDDMVSIITGLNGIVRDLLKERGITRQRLIPLATGDGMCLGLLSSSAKEQITFAFALRDAVDGWNEMQTIPRLEFKLRTALNIYEDFKIKDINNKQNLIGHGINTAARILGQCQPGEIVVSGHMYSGLEKDGDFMRAFSPEKEETIKGETYRYRRIELREANRTWITEKDGIASKPVATSLVPSLGLDMLDAVMDPIKMVQDMQAAMQSSSSARFKVGPPLEEVSGSKREGPKPKLLLDDPFDENQIADNKLRHAVVQGGAWLPSLDEPKRKVLIGHQSYSKEYLLKSPLRTFDALVSPNGESFKFGMKLMDRHGNLGAHMVFGEVSFTLKNDSETDGSVLSYLVGGEHYERKLAVNLRSRFEVGLKVRNVRAGKLSTVQLSINGNLVLTKMIPQEFTTRFGLVVSGNGAPCHMSISGINIYRVAK